MRLRRPRSLRPAQRRARRSREEGGRGRGREREGMEGGCGWRIPALSVSVAPRRRRLSPLVPPPPPLAPSPPCLRPDHSQRPPSPLLRRRRARVSRARVRSFVACRRVVCVRARSRGHCHGVSVQLRVLCVCFCRTSVECRLCQPPMYLSAVIAADWLQPLGGGRGAGAPGAPRGPQTWSTSLGGGGGPRRHRAPRRSVCGNGAPALTSISLY